MRWVNSVARLISKLTVVKGPKTERRKHPRLDTRNLLKVIRTDTTLGPSITNLVNLSEGGMQFTYPKSIIPETICWLLLNVAEKNAQIPITARVIWTHKEKNGTNTYRSGLEFLDIDEDDRNLLRDYISNALEFQSLPPFREAI